MLLSLNYILKVHHEDRIEKCKFVQEFVFGSRKVNQSSQLSSSWLDGNILALISVAWVIYVLYIQKVGVSLAVFNILANNLYIRENGLLVY